MYICSQVLGKLLLWSWAEFTPRKKKGENFQLKFRVKFLLVEFLLTFDSWNWPQESNVGQVRLEARMWTTVPWSILIYMRMTNSLHWDLSQVKRWRREKNVNFEHFQFGSSQTKRNETRIKFNSRFFSTSQKKLWHEKVFLSLFKVFSFPETFWINLRIHLHRKRSL